MLHVNNILKSWEKTGTRAVWEPLYYIYHTMEHYKIPIDFERSGTQSSTKVESRRWSQDCLDFNSGSTAY